MINFLQKNKQKIFLIFLCLALVVIFYGSYLNLYFSQDDFFHFRVSITDGSLKSFLSLFEFKSFSERGGIYFYRPLFREALFNVYYRFFGVNPLPFRLTHFAIHLINVFLTYKIIQKITKNHKIGIISAFFTGLVAPNVGILSYLAGGITVSGMLMMSLVSILLYTSNLENNNLRYKLGSYLFFILALISHETAATIPMINILISLYKNGYNFDQFWKGLKSNLWYFLPVIILTILEVFVIGLPVNEMNYGFSLSITKLLNSYFWYGLWGVGTPEMLLDFVGPGFVLNANLMKYWGNYFIIIFSTLGFIGLLFMLFIKKLFNNKNFITFLFWFFVALTPVVFLPFHRQYHYLELALPAIGAIVGIIYLEINKKNKILAVSFVGLFLVLNYTSVKLADITHWSISRSKKAQRILTNFKKTYPNLPKGAIVFFTNDLREPYFNEEWGHSSKQASIILSGSDAIQVLYHDKTIKVYYEDLSIPEEKNVYKFQVSTE